MGSSAVQPPSPDFVSTAEIDRSCRWPVLFLFISAIAWLILGLALGIISSIKAHAPGFLADVAWLTYGRVRPAYWDLILYGFASQAGLGTGLWMLARLGRTSLAIPGLAALGGILWNVGVTCGLGLVLAGQSTGLAWMEMPRQAAVFLGGGIFLLALSAFYTLYDRRERELYISQWFLIAALFVFPWLLSAAYLLGAIDPVRGVMQAVVNAWFTNGFQYLWLTPLALAAAYYLLPKFAAQPVYSNQAAVLGFWVLIVFGSWSGLSLLFGGPVPRWMINAGTAAKFMLLVPTACFATNWFVTLRRGKQPRSPVWKFLSMGAMAFIVATVLDVASGLGPVGVRTSLTTYPVGVTQLAVFGFVGMVLFASIYYVTERVLDAPWTSEGKIKLHYRMSVAGIVLMVVANLVGGIILGSRLNDPGIPFLQASRSLVPFLGIATLGMIILCFAQLVFGWHLLVTLLRGTAGQRAEFCRACCGSSQESKKTRVGA